MEPDRIIIAFLKIQTAMTIATSVNNIPYCATCFYAYCEEAKLLVFKSSINTVHVQNGIRNNKVSGSILPDKLITGKVKGLQFLGLFFQPEDDLFSKAKLAYYKKYPFALAIPGELWAISLSMIKFTDNTLGFGKKLSWENKVNQTNKF